MKKNLIKENKLISVIIPLYNSEKYIEDTIVSVLKQKYKFFEIIVIDDKSTDNSLKIVEALAKTDPRIIIIKRKKNFGGPAVPRNQGIGRARGNFVAFLDADDIWTENKLEIVYKTLLEHPEIDVFYHNEKHISLNKKEYIYKFAQIDNANSYEFLLYGNHIATSSAVVKIENLKRTGGFSKNKTFISSEDYDLWLRMAMGNAFFYRHKEDLGIRKYRSDSISANRKTHRNSFFSVYRQHMQYLYDAEAISEKEYLNYIYLFFFFRDFYVAKKKFSDGEFKVFFSKFFEAIKNNFTLEIDKIYFSLKFIFKRHNALKQAKEINLFE